MPRNRRRNRRSSSSARTPSPAGIQRVRPPKTRLKPLLQLLIDVPRAAEAATLTIGIPKEDTEKHLVMFDASVLLRASNALKAVRLLCEEAHWEFAAPILRQLFELVINVEYIAAQADREAAIFRYSKYGLLQEVRHQHLTLIYDQKTGRDIDTQRLAVLEQMLEQTFPEFRRVNSQAKVHWLPSWSGHGARHLAERSKHRLRADQYDLLFSAWSEEAHGAPAALMENMFPSGLPAEQIVASDDAEIIQTVTMAVTLFLEIWMLLPHVPQLDGFGRASNVGEQIDIMVEARRGFAIEGPERGTFTVTKEEDGLPSCSRSGLRIWDRGSWLYSPTQRGLQVRSLLAIRLPQVTSGRRFPRSPGVPSPDRSELR